MIAKSTELETLAQEAVSTIKNGDTDVIADWFKGIWPSVVNFGIRVLLVIVVFCVGRKLIKLAVKLADKSFERMGMELTLKKFLKYLIRFIGYCLLFILIVMAAGKDAASFAAIFSSAWVALGLSLQGSLSNFAGGILIMAFKPFRVGDYIIECVGNHEGVVQSIGLVYTEILAADNKRLVIPNGNLANNSIINVTAMGKRRVDVSVGISYSADLLKAKEVARSVLDSNKLLIEDDEKEVFVSELADSSVVLGIRGWAKNDNYFKALWSVNEQVKMAFDKEGIEIPFNQLDVHVK